ncbi:hypothetical protein R3P38DRAFT_3202552 [Favolaschia claudopus]|uniref:Uncharacterized protein n=1 Tax=Favolaschia claudopus TaxID=2862362 RepID=A0AAW0ATS5_9AGAR
MVFDEQPNANYNTLDYTATIPVYNARFTTFNAATDIDRIGEVLPQYTDNNGEIRNNSCAAVGYTITQARYKDGKEHIHFNLKWVIVVGEP